MLQERSGEKLKQFFEAYGPAEAAAMCYLLATADKQSMVSQSTVLQYNLSTSSMQADILTAGCSGAEASCAAQTK
jgi:hypothetical protein